MYTKPIHLASLLLPLLFNPSLALNIGEKAFDIRSALVGFNYYEVTVSRANETDANENSYPTTRCENNPDASSPLQIEMECSIQCPCPSCSDECPELEGDLANPIKVVLQQPPRTGDGRPDFNTSGVNFIMEAEGGRHGWFRSKGPLLSANKDSATGVNVWRLNYEYLSYDGLWLQTYVATEVAVLQDL